MGNMVDPIINGFMLGITTGPFCFTACIPVLLSMTLAVGGESPAYQTWLFLGKFVAGRFVAYLTFGLVMGILGSSLGGLSHRIGTIATILLSVVLIVHGLGVHLPHAGMCHMAGRSAGNRFFPFILGGLTGLNICPPFLLAISYTLQRAVTPSFGICFFMSFFIATTLYILPVGIVGHISHHEVIARVGRVATVAVGIAFFYQGVSALIPG